MVWYDQKHRVQVTALLRIQVTVGNPRNPTVAYWMMEFKSLAASP